VDGVEAGNPALDLADELTELAVGQGGQVDALQIVDGGNPGTAAGRRRYIEHTFEDSSGL
jgi:hypothetical protein